MRGAKSHSEKQRSHTRSLLGNIIEPPRGNRDTILSFAAKKTFDPVDYATEPCGDFVDLRGKPISSKSPRVQLVTSTDAVWRCINVFTFAKCSRRGERRVCRESALRRLAGPFTRSRRHVSHFRRARSGVPPSLTLPLKGGGNKRGRATARATLRYCLSPVAFSWTKAILPSTMVMSTGMSLIFSGSIDSGSWASTARSASLPVSIEPLMRSSKPL